MMMMMPTLGDASNRARARRSLHLSHQLRPRSACWIVRGSLERQLATAAPEATPATAAVWRKQASNLNISIYLQPFRNALGIGVHFCPKGFMGSNLCARNGKRRRKELCRRCREYRGSYHGARRVDGWMGSGGCEKTGGVVEAFRF